MNHGDMMFIHLSDTHIQPEGQRLWNIVDGYQASLKVIENIRAYGVRPDFFVISGDLVHDHYELGYVRFKSLLEKLESEFGAPVILCLGNHDNREAFQRIVLGLENADPDGHCNDRRMINGIKVLALDSLMPGEENGYLGEHQLAWLSDELAADREIPKLLVVHHPPTPVVLGRDRIELQDADQLAQIVSGQNIIGILSGHIHHPYMGIFAGLLTVAATGTAFTVRHSYAAGKLEVLNGSGYNQVYIRNGAMYVNPVEIPGDRTTVTWA